MRNITFLFIITLGLTGCVGAQTQALNTQYQDQFQREANAWKNVNAQFPSVCNVDTSIPPTKARAVELSNCNTRLVNQYVMPVAAFPDLVTNMRIQALRNAGLFEEGKISQTELSARSQENFANYLAQIEGRYKGHLDTTLQQEQANAAHTSAVLQGLAASTATPDAPVQQSDCRFNPANNSYQQCLHVMVGGKCAMFGAGC